MGNPARQIHSIEQFLAWIAGQERKHELVNGEPAIMLSCASPPVTSGSLILVWIADRSTTRRWTVPTLDYILLIDPDIPQVRLYQRDEGGIWTSERIAGLDVAVGIADLELNLPLSELYESLAFTPGPALIEAVKPLN